MLEVVLRLARRQQLKQSVVLVIYVLNDPEQLPDTLPVVNVLKGGKLTPTDLLCCPLQCIAIEGGAVPVSGCDAPRQDNGLVTSL